VVQEIVGNGHRHSPAGIEYLQCIAEVGHQTSDRIVGPRTLKCVVHGPIYTSAADHCLVTLITGQKFS
jgi:hypothetical protein